MPRYIDVTEAVGIGYLSNWYQNSIDNTVPPVWTDEHLKELTNDFIIIPNDTPTADVQEMKHGKWKQVQTKSPKYACTNCLHLFNNKSFKYCPNCGAKMDKE